MRLTNGGRDDISTTLSDKHNLLCRNHNSATRVVLFPSRQTAAAYQDEAGDNFAHWRGTFLPAAKPSRAVIICRQNN